MKNLINCMKSDSYKLIHTRILLVHLLAPLIAIAVFCGYYSYSGWHETSKVLVYIQVVAFAFPFLISIVTTMLYEQETNAGHFQPILTVPFSKLLPHISKVITLAMFGLFSCMLTIVGFGIIFRSMGFTTVPLALYLKVSLLLFMTNIGLYLLQYLVAFRLGHGLSLGFGIVGTVLSLLLYLVIGDQIWRFIPFGWGIRMSSYYMMQHISTSVPNVVVNDYSQGKIIVFVLTGFIFLVFLLFNSLWQGNSNHSE